MIMAVLFLFYRPQCTLCWRTPMRKSSPTQTCSSQHTNSSSSREVPLPLISHLLPSHLIAQQEGIPLIGQLLSPPRRRGDKRWGRCPCTLKFSLWKESTHEQLKILCNQHFISWSAISSVIRFNFRTESQILIDFVGNRFSWESNTMKHVSTQSGGWGVMHASKQGTRFVNKELFELHSIEQGTADSASSLGITVRFMPAP